MTTTPFDHSSGEPVRSRRQQRSGWAVTDADMDRIGSWFGCPPGNGWTWKEADAWMAIKDGILSGDLEALEWYYHEARKRYGAEQYLDQREHGFWLCRSKEALFGKWREQVDKARARHAEDQSDSVELNTR